MSDWHSWISIRLLNQWWSVLSSIPIFKIPDVHTGSRQGQGPGSIVCYYARPVQCSVKKPWPSAAILIDPGHAPLILSIPIDLLVMLHTGRIRRCLLRINWVLWCCLGVLLSYRGVLRFCGRVLRLFYGIRWVRICPITRRGCSCTCIWKNRDSCRILVGKLQESQFSSAVMTIVIEVNIIVKLNLFSHSKYFCHPHEWQ